jgi:hypothetical protein
MRKVAHTQRPLFEPWLAWRELPDSVRGQALDVLTALYLEFIDVPRLGEQTSHNPSAAESTRSQSELLPSMEPETDDAPPH